MFHTEAILWFAVIPAVAGFGFLIYGVVAPMAHADGWPIPTLAKSRIYGGLFFACTSLAILAAASLEYHGATTSPKPTFIGKVSFLNRIPLKSGWDAEFTLAADDGSSVNVRTDRYLRGLKNGDRVQAQMITFNGDLSTLDVLTGDLAGYLLDFRGLPRRQFDIMLVLDFFWSLLGAGFASGVIKDRRSFEPIAKQAMST
jgi:hypothetical protein